MLQIPTMIALLAAVSCCLAQQRALKGLDPVLLTEGKEVAGKPDLAAIHGKFQYLFSSSETRSRFEKDPARYGIQLNGDCIMGPNMDGRPDLFVVHEGRIYIGASDWCLGNFKAAPTRFVDPKTGQRPPNPNVKRAGILVFPGVQIIDYTGPYEVLGAGGFETFIVGQTLDPIKTAMGMSIMPRFTFADCPKLAVLVVPGGGGSRPGFLGVGAQLENAACVEFIQARAKEAQILMSVCNGAFLLAKAGLLDGMTATTFSGGLDNLAKDFPKVKVINDQRYVDNGKVITTAGLSSGIDGALRVIERLRGKGQAQRTALGIEYDWRPDSGYARGALADMLMRPAIAQGFDIPDNNTWIVESDEGDRTRWTKTYTVGYEGCTTDGLLAIVDKQLEKTWKKGQSGAHDGGFRTIWSFTDKAGTAWNGFSEASVKDAEKRHFTLIVRIARA